MENLKERIKTLAALQPELKNQRKTFNLVGERTMPTYEAAHRHKTNRYDLRHLYMAYGLLRGREQEEVESNPEEPINMEVVEKLMEQYKQIEVKEDGE